jgi:uridylate kinase
MSKLFVLSLGGSIIIPDDIDTKFLKQFRAAILKQIKKGNRFVIVTGGGKVCRRYQEALLAVSKSSAEDLDWMGIETTYINARLIQLMFGKLAHPDIVKNPTVKTSFKEKILVAGGWKPGWSTDYVAMRLSELYGSSTLINLSNIDYVYDKDPRKFKQAKKIESISWKEFRRMFSSKWNPGANVPFDPVAAKLAEKKGKKVIIANGKDIENLESILSGKRFKGTKIS